jgi:GTPase
MQEKNNYLYNIQITVVSGNGGNGCISFRRESNAPKGGPNGGDGGKGGSVFIRANRGILTLADFKQKRVWKARNGEDGSSTNRKGKDAEDIFIDVPIGTQVWDGSGILFDVDTDGRNFLVAKGGEGGLGNQNFATPELQAPNISTEGEEGQTKIVTLLLKHMADVGVVGMPNAGKSSLVHKISRAKVKIGDYAFSTIDPVLGVCEHNGKKIIFADLPGLIEGSHLNIGLGHQFLQHLERCKILLHLVDASDPGAVDSFLIILNEIKIYDSSLLNKKYVVCLSKIDLASDELIESNKSALEKLGYKVHLLSENRQDLIDKLLDFIKSELF